MARDPNSSMITSPFGNGQGKAFYEAALNKIAPELNAPKPQPKPEVKIEAQKKILHVHEEQGIPATEIEVKPISKAQKKLFKELTALMIEHANLESLDSKIGKAVFETSTGEKIVLQMV